MEPERWESSGKLNLELLQNAGFSLIQDIEITTVIVYHSSVISF